MVTGLYKYKGKKYRVKKSGRQGKQLQVKLPNNKIIHFGDKSMTEYPGTGRGDNYCARSYGIGEKYNVLNDPTSPNFWSRKLLWNCVGKKSMDKLSSTRLNKIG